MLVNLHPRIEEALRNPEHGTVIDGVFASQALDTSGEIIDIKGVDISSLNEDGVLNVEHNNPDKKETASFSVLIGRIIFAKKVFSEEDCESERELRLWRQLEIPFIYGASELFDAEDHENAKAAASIIKHYHKRGLPVVIRYSIEGSTLDRQGNFLTSTLARRVACTIKPCNRSSFSGLVAEPETASVGVEKFEKSGKYITAVEMEYSPTIEGPIDVFKHALGDLKELNKAMTLGSSNVAPDMLTGGAALAVEDSPRQMLKAQVLAALRDWDGLGALEVFLKHRLPDADPEFVSRFAKLASNIRITKSETNDLGPPLALKALNSKAPSGSRIFKDKHVVPGEVELVAGPYSGSKLKLLHLDDNYAYVQPFQAGDLHEVKVNKINRQHEGSHFIVTKDPEILKLPNHVDANKHSDLNLTLFHRQKELLHGIDLASEPLVQTHPHGSTEARTKGVIGWLKSAHDKVGYIKPAVMYKGKLAKAQNDKEGLDPDGSQYISTARREVIFHNLAHTFWGLGEYVPNTALFNHPGNGEDHSVMELVPHAEHVQISDPSHHGYDKLKAIGDSGVLVKLAIMDSVMGNADRERINYMVSPNAPGVHLIDNALIFNYQDDFLPAYLHDYYYYFKNLNLDEAEIPYNVLHWLLSLDPFQFGIELSKAGVGDEIINEAVSRLLSMQSEVVMHHTKVNDILFAHSRYKNFGGQ